MSSFVVKEDMNGTPAEGPRQLTQAFFNVPGRVIVIGIDMNKNVVSGYYNHHIDNGVLIGMGKDDIISTIDNLKFNYDADCVMIIVRSNDWLNKAESITVFDPEIKHYVVDEINEVDGRGKSMLCDSTACCGEDGWDIKSWI
jgi:hypothetical protein